ncbi:odorant receptor 25 [Nasonia vitripennis]|uniref:Odorant receptor n=1 Tax=Nasonia vitripennis TaxID=7425 RepID=A0A7M6UVS6_NASVI|nr:odorant receptor 25 [Nasonia vitripennis]
MDGKRGFDHAFSLCRINLGTVGLWPNSKNGKGHQEVASLIFFIISLFTIIVFVNLAQTVKLIMIWGDLNHMIDNISTANLPIAVVVFKMLTFRRYKKTLTRLLGIAMDDWCTKKTSREAENMSKNARTARKMSLVCVVLGFGSVNGQLAVRISQELDILPGQTEKRLPMLSSYIPYEYQTSPAYEITWFMQYLGAVLATLVYSGVYCVFVGLVLHLRGQVANLRFMFESVDDPEEDKGKNFRRRLRSLVERHESLNRFAEDIENIFTLMFLAEILSCTIQICLQVFLLVTLMSNDNGGVPILQILFMMVYAMHVGTHVFICCYVADKLRDESLSICDLAYNYEWYRLPARDARLLLFIMLRAERPLEVTAGKFCAFSLRLYAQILKTSGGYLSMLLAVKDRSTNF